MSSERDDDDDGDAFNTGSVVDMHYFIWSSQFSEKGLLYCYLHFIHEDRSTHKESWLGHPASKSRNQDLNLHSLDKCCQSFPIKDQTVDILDFVGHTIPHRTAQLCCCHSKAVRGALLSISGCLSEPLYVWVCYGISCDLGQYSVPH